MKIIQNKVMRGKFVFLSTCIFLFFIIFLFPFVHSVSIDCGSSPSNPCPDRYQYRTRYGNADGDWVTSSYSTVSTTSGSCSGTSTQTGYFDGIGTHSNPIQPFCSQQGDVEYQWRIRVHSSGTSPTAAQCADGSPPSQSLVDHDTAWRPAYTVDWDNYASHCECSGRTYIDGSTLSGCCNDGYSTHGSAWISGTEGENMCCDQSILPDNYFCSANSRWGISGEWCETYVRQNNKYDGDFTQGVTDLQCGCDSSSVICSSRDSPNSQGVCASSVCSTAAVARIGDTYYDGCSSAAAPGYGVECDSNVNSGASPTYMANGVCGGTNHGTCYIQWGSDVTSSITPSSNFGTESAVCSGNSKMFCDNLGDGSFSPGNKRCDGSNAECVECDFSIYQKTNDGTCEYGCDAPFECDDQDPYSTMENIGWCYGVGGCQNFCDSYIRDGTSTGNPNSGEAVNSCGGCSPATSGQRCDSNFDGIWNGVCGLNAENEWDCVMGEVAISLDDNLHYDGCFLVPDSSECTAGISVGGYFQEGICGQDSEFGNICCRDELVYVDSSTRDCACREEYDGFSCSTNPSGFDPENPVWNGACAQHDDNVWRCKSGAVYYDGSLYKSYSSVDTEGFMCHSSISSDGFVQNGMTAGRECQTSHSGNRISCPEGSGNDCYFNCNGMVDAQGGTMCMTHESYTTNIEFFQEGLCTHGGCYIDDSSDSAVCFDSGAGTFFGDCSSCAQTRGSGSDIHAYRGDHCTVSHRDGGNYDAEGLCTTNAACSVGEEICVDSETDEFREGCSACNVGSLCQSSATTSFRPDGYCSANECVSIDWEFGNYVDTSGTEEFDNAPVYCGENPSLTRNQLCSFNTASTDTFDDIANHRWDGLCVEYDSQHGYYNGWKCDAGLVTCRFDADTVFDYYSTCSESLLDSTMTDSSDFESSQIYNSEISFSIIQDSEIHNSDISSSTLSRSNIFSSSLDGVVLTDSIVLNSNLCSGISGSNLRISNGVLASGIMFLDGNEYYPPFRIIDACEGTDLTLTGFLSFNETAVSDGMSLEVYYVSSETGLTVTVNMEEVGGPEILSLIDDNSDGIYRGVVDSIYFDGNDDLVEITASVSHVGDWDVSAGLFIRNTGPDASLSITSILGNEDITPSSTVILESSYSDFLGVDSCRFANDDQALLIDATYVPCSSMQYWDLHGEDGNRTVYMEVKGISGATTIVSNSIIYDSTFTGANEGPTRPIVLTDSGYTNDLTRLNFRWYNSTDEYQSLLGNPIFYDYFLCEQDGDCEYKGRTTETEITLTNLELNYDSGYYLKVWAFNIDGKYSARNATSPLVLFDLSPPTIPTITTNVSSDEWESGNNMIFSFDADDSLSGVAGFTTSLSTSIDVMPDSVIDNTNGTVEYNSLPSGYYTLRVRAVDAAGNIGPMASYNFKVSSGRPTIPRMLTFEVEGSDLTFQWTQSFHISGISHYELVVATESDFVSESIVNRTDVISFGEDIISATLNLPSGLYFGKVRSLSNVDTYSLYSSEIGDLVDFDPPRFTFQKPAGLSVSPRPLLALRTNKIAYCTYFSPDLPGSVSHRLFDVTNMRTHETRVELGEDGNYEFEILCTDQIGNINSTIISFEVDQSRVPDTLSIQQSSTQLYEGQLATINFDLRDGQVGLGELHHSEFEFNFETDDEIVLSAGYSLADLGGGSYQAAFVTPVDTNEVEVTIIHSATGISDSITFDISELDMDFDCEDCGFIQTDGDLVVPSENTLSISSAEASDFDIHVCPGSLEHFSDAQCILIENLGDGAICIGFSATCESDSVAYVIED